MKPIKIINNVNGLVFNNSNEKIIYSLVQNEYFLKILYKFIYTTKLPKIPKLSRKIKKLFLTDFLYLCTYVIKFSVLPFSGV